jgi:hypothetical protein
MGPGSILLGIPDRNTQILLPFIPTTLTDRLPMSIGQLFARPRSRHLEPFGLGCTFY